MGLKKCALCHSAAIAAAILWSGSARAVVLDGSLTPGEGYGATPLVTQTNVTTSTSSDGGGPGGVAQEASASNTSRKNQLSNAYAYIDTSNASAPMLNLFIGGSFEQETADSHIELALQTTATGGVSDLTGQNLPGGLPKVAFQGFTPNVLFTLTPFVSGGTGTAGDGGTTVKDLSNPSAAAVVVTSNHGDANLTTTVGQATNDALVNSTIGAGSGNPNFADATTGMEFSIPLTTLPGASTGYTSGDIKAFIFMAEGSYGRTNNQLLSPFTYGTDSNDYDYTYIDNTNSSSGSSVGRQFVGSVYPVNTSAANPGGNQYFTIPGAPVPEPTSAALLGVAGVSLLGRRGRRVKA